MRPDFIIHANREDITDKIKNALIALTITDEAGWQSDTLRVLLDDRDGQLLLPPTGASLAVSLGFTHTGLINMGLYTVDTLQLQGPPATLTIEAKAADMIAGMKTKQSRLWENITLAHLVNTIAATHGLTAKVAPSLAAQHWEKLAQSRESDMHLLTRVAHDFEAIAKVAQGHLLLVPKGQAQSATDQPLSQVTLRPSQVASYQVTLADREKYAAVKAYWHNKGTGRGVAVQAGRGKPVHALRTTYSDATTAQRAADAKLIALNQGAGTLQLRLTPGQVAIGAETPLQLQGFRVGVDGDWIVTRATHTLDNNGLSSQIEAQTAKT